MLQPEIIGIGLIIVVQFYVFYRTYRHTNKLDNIFPKSQLSLKSIALDPNEADLLTEGEVNSKVSIPDESELSIESLFKDQLFIDVIEYSVDFTDSFKKILKSTNHYLVRNKNHAADFRLLKEIAEREVETLENQIETTINLPLYLGLLGTIVGIVLGLYNLYPAGAVDTEALILNVEDEIPKLLRSVAIAMIASFAGLLLTIISNGALYKTAIKNCDYWKSKYLSFVQTELLPKLSKDKKDNFEELTNSLNNFNTAIKKTIKEGFSDSFEMLDIGIGKLSDAVNEIKEVQGLQNQSISELNKVDFKSMVKMFNTIQTSGVELNKGFEAQRELLGYIHESLKQIKEKELQTRSFIAELDNTFKKAAEVLSDSAKSELIGFKSFVAEEANLLQKAIERSRPEFSQLTHLETIDQKLEKVIVLNEVNSKFDNLLIQIKDGNTELVNQINKSNGELVRVLQSTVKTPSSNKRSLPVSRQSVPTSPTKPTPLFNKMIERLRKLFVK